MVKRAWALGPALAVVVAACATGADTTSTSAATTTTSTPGDDTPFELIVEPLQFYVVSPGQRCVALAEITGGSSPVAVAVSVSGAAAVEPAEASLHPGQVAEFTVIPQQESIGTTLMLELTAERGVRETTQTRTLEVVDWPDELEPLATELRDRFVSYLEQNRPELGITGETEWIPTITKPQILVVMHYLFFSEDWEMGITWHVTVPEHAWSRMYLRPRDELRPTIGLEIPSYLDPLSAPVPWEPPSEVDR